MKKVPAATAAASTCIGKHQQQPKQQQRGTFFLATFPMLLLRHAKQLAKFHRRRRRWRLLESTKQNWSNRTILFSSGRNANRRPTVVACNRRNVCPAAKFDGFGRRRIRRKKKYFFIFRFSFYLNLYIFFNRRNVLFDDFVWPTTKWHTLECWSSLKSKNKCFQNSNIYIYIHIKVDDTRDRKSVTFNNNNNKSEPIDKVGGKRCVQIPGRSLPSASFGLGPHPGVKINGWLQNVEIIASRLQQTRNKKKQKATTTTTRRRPSWWVIH